MAKAVDELIVEIRADTKDLQKQLKNIQGRIGNAGKTGGTAFVPMIGSLKKMLPLLASVGTAILAIGQIRDIAKVGMEFEDLNDSLNTVFGSVQRGTAAFNKIIQFAQTTPFQIESVARAFIQLKGAGIEPNMEMLQTFADTASTSVDQLGAFEAMVRLVSRSASGGLGLEEINQLDDRGIPATKILTEALGVTRLELSKFGQTAEGAADMVDKLIQGMNQRFGGAMEQKMDNLSTKTSNMTIAFKELKNAIFEGVLESSLKGLADQLTRMASATALIVRAATGIQTVADLRIATGVTETDPAKALEEARRMLEKAQSQQTTGGGGLMDPMSFGTMLGDSERIANLEKLIALLTESLPEANDVIDEGAKKTSKFSEEIGKLDTVVLEAAQTLSREFADALLEGESLLKSFSDFTKSIVSEIIATFLRLAIVEPILKGIFPSLGTGTGTPTVESAGGGLATHGRPMLVGERGPELFVPHAPGNIVNAADTRSSLGGGGVVINQNISFATGVVPTVRAEVTKMLPQIADVSKAAVLDATLRGGSFSKGMRGRNG